MMNNFSRLSLVLLVSSSVPVFGDYYVAPGGNDNAKGTKGAPFETIQRARDAARKDKGHSTVYLRGGTYRLSETVVFSLADGDTTYAAYQDETPIITSAVPVTNWKKDKDNLWVADMPDGVKDFKVMYDGNRMLERARSRGFQGPQQNFKKFATRNVALPEDRPLLRRLEFPVGEIQDWDNISDVEAFFCACAVDI